MIGFHAQDASYTGDLPIELHGLDVEAKSGADGGDVLIV